MTVRSILNQRLRRIMLFVYPGFVAFLLSILVSEVVGIPVATFAGILGLAAVYLIMLHALLWSIRCPFCRGNLAPLALKQWRMSMDSSLRFCPYCGALLDAEYGTTETTVES